MRGEDVDNEPVKTFQSSPLTANHMTRSVVRREWVVKWWECLNGNEENASKWLRVNCGTIVGRDDKEWRRNATVLELIGTKDDEKTMRAAL